MRFTLSLVAFVAAVVSLTIVHPVLAQGAANTSGIQIAALSPCFNNCAAVAATGVGCKGVEADLPCVCASATFVAQIQTCIDESKDDGCKALGKNKTALMQGNEVFKGVCKAAGAEMPNKNGSNSNEGKDANGVTKDSTDSNTANATSSMKKDGAAGMVIPSLGQMASLLVAFTAVLAGVSTLV